MSEQRKNQHAEVPPADTGVSIVVRIRTHVPVDQAGDIVGNVIKFVEEVRRIPGATVSLSLEINGVRMTAPTETEE